MTKKAILIFPDGVGIRNYLYSDVFKNTSSELILLHNFDDATEKLISEVTAIRHFYKLPKYVESIKEKFLREVICLSRLKYNAKITQNSTILASWKKTHIGSKNKVFYKIVELLSRKYKSYDSILKLESKYQKSIRNTDFYNEIARLFGELNPDLIFCAHQRAVECAPIFAVAADKKISSSTVIYSWDNLPKARLALRADKYLVWSNHMKQEMQQFYPEIDSEKVIISGTPQFEFYDNTSNIITRSAFYRRFKLDESKKIICFSGDDVKTSPDDPKYLFDLASEIIANNLENEYQILLRRCPVDNSGRFDNVISQFPNLIKLGTPLWTTNSETWTTIFPLPDDVSLLVSTAYYCDIVVNVGSTMAFDFGMFKKPCIFIAYEQEFKSDPDWSVKTIYNYQHFRSMPTDSAVIWWKNKQEITTLIKQAKYPAEMNLWTEKIIGQDKHASRNIATILKL